MGIVLIFGQSLGMEAEHLKPPMLVAVLTISAVAAAIVSVKMVPNCLHDGSPTGAAWKLGGWFRILQGLGIGVIISSCWVLVATTILPPETVDQGPNSLTKMALTPGVSRQMWALAALLVAPIGEELLFRGVLYGGLRHSFGRLWAAVLTTIVFVLMHITDIAHYPPAASAITVMALAALWCRLRSHAVGPAVALHLGYNGFLACILIR